MAAVENPSNNPGSTNQRDLDRKPAVAMMRASWYPTRVCMIHSRINVSTSFLLLTIEFRYISKQGNVLQSPRTIRFTTVDLLERLQVVTKLPHNGTHKNHQCSIRQGFGISVLDDPFQQSIDWPIIQHVKNSHNTTTLLSCTDNST